MPLATSTYQTQLQSAFTTQKPALVTELTTILSDVTSNKTAAQKADEIATAINDYITNSMASVATAGETFVKSGTVTTTLAVTGVTPGVGAAGGTGIGSIA